MLVMSDRAYLLLAVILCDSIDVDAEPHELGQGLLTHKSLGLQIALLHALGREHLRPTSSINS